LFEEESNDEICVVILIIERILRSIPDWNTGSMIK